MSGTEKPGDKSENKARLVPGAKFSPDDMPYSKETWARQAFKVESSSIVNVSSGKMFPTDGRRSLGSDPAMAEKAMAELQMTIGLNNARTLVLADAIDYLGQQMGEVNPASLVEAVKALAPIAKSLGLSETSAAALSATLLGEKVQPDIAVEGGEELLLILKNAESSTREEKAIWKSKGIKPEELSSGMKTNPEATIIKALSALKNMTEKEREEVLHTSQLGREGITVTEALIKNPAVLESNFSKVENPENYAGSLYRSVQTHAQISYEVINQFSTQMEAFFLAIGEKIEEIKRHTDPSYQSHNQIIGMRGDMFPYAQYGYGNKEKGSPYGYLSQLATGLVIFGQTLNASLHSSAPSLTTSGQHSNTTPGPRLLGADGKPINLVGSPSQNLLRTGVSPTQSRPMAPIVGAAAGVLSVVSPYLALIIVASSLADAFLDLETGTQKAIAAQNIHSDTLKFWVQHYDPTGKAGAAITNARSTSDIVVAAAQAGEQRNKIEEYQAGIRKQKEAVADIKNKIHKRKNDVSGSTPTDIRGSAPAWDELIRKIDELEKTTDQEKIDTLLKEIILGFNAISEKEKDNYATELGEQFALLYNGGKGAEGMLGMKALLKLMEDSLAKKTQIRGGGSMIQNLMLAGQGVVGLGQTVMDELGNGLSDQMAIIQRNISAGTATAQEKWVWNSFSGMNKSGSIEGRGLVISPGTKTDLPVVPSNQEGYFNRGGISPSPVSNIVITVNASGIGNDELVRQISGQVETTINGILRRRQSENGTALYDGPN